jgi:hypothetical protein
MQMRKTVMRIRKVRLEVDALSVESFDTGSPMVEEKGTVHGHAQYTVFGGGGSLHVSN